MFQIQSETTWPRGQAHKDDGTVYSDGLSCSPALLLRDALLLLEALLLQEALLSKAAIKALDFVLHHGL